MIHTTRAIAGRLRPDLIVGLIIAGGSLSTAFAAESPYVLSVSPLSGPPGTVITMTGQQLSNIKVAWIGNGHDAGVTNVSDSAVKITVPKDASTGQIAIGNGTNWAWTPQDFKVTAAAGSGTPPVTTPPVTTPPVTTPPVTTPPVTTPPVTTPPVTTPPVTTPPVTTPPAGSSSMSVKVSGNHLVDGSGKTLQLRGVDVSGLEFVAVQGWDPSNPWGGQTGTPTPNWSAITAWDANVVRIPLNEASWLGYTCTDAAGATHNPDPGANYKSTVATTVSQATAAGLYVILDLHLTAPGNFCPLIQNQMADSNHSTAFWSSVAAQFKGVPSVMFELFNEPFVGSGAAVSTDWNTIMQGGGQTNYLTGGSPAQVNYNWTTAGMQQMLNAVRATGATNVVLVGGASWAQDLSQWVAKKPTDSANQMAAAWHAYGSGAVGSAAAALPGFGSVAYTYAQSVLDAGIPVVITETGDHNAPGTVGAPLLANLLPWADTRSVSYVGWAWDPWGDADDILIKDAAGTPTDGYGVFFKQHLTCMAAANCSTSTSSGGSSGGTTGGTGGTTGGTGGTTGGTGGTTGGTGGTTGGTGGTTGGTGGGTTTTPPANAFWVYYNGVYNWGGDYSFVATANYKDTAGKPLSGPYDIAVNVTGPYGGFLPFAGGTVPLWNFNAAPYSKLTFAIKAPSSNFQMYFVKVGDVALPQSCWVQDLGSEPNVGTFTANQWSTFTIPLSRFCVGAGLTGGTSIYKFAVQDQTGKVETFYLDNIAFE